MTDIKALSISNLILLNHLLDSRGRKPEWPEEIHAEETVRHQPTYKLYIGGTVRPKVDSCNY